VHHAIEYDRSSRGGSTRPPLGSLAVVAFCTLALANVVAAVPGRRAAGTAAALALRAE